MKSRWLPVVGFEGLYEVSDTGQVRSITRTINGKTYIGCVRACCTNKAGYRSVDLYRAQTRVTRTVHSLVAEAFIGDRPNGLEVCHGSLGITNDSLGNLYYGTRSQNMEDKKRDGTEQLGERHWNSKLSDAQAHELRQRAIDGEPHRVLAAAFGVSTSCVSMIKTGKRRSLQPRDYEE